MVTVMLLAAATAASQVQQPPDSTYLLLVGELPELGTFSYTAFTGNRRTDVHRRIQDVQIDGCTLSFQVWVQQITDGTLQSTLPRNFFEAAYAVPLKAIDPERLNVRFAHARPGTRFDAPPSLLQILLKRDTQPIIMRNLETRHEARVRTTELVFADQRDANLVKGWLADAANRCETWDTAPMQPIR